MQKLQICLGFVRNLENRIFHFAVERVYLLLQQVPIVQKYASELQIFHFLKTVLSHPNLLLLV